MVGIGDDQGETAILAHEIGQSGVIGLADVLGELSGKPEHGLLACFHRLLVLHLAWIGHQLDGMGLPLVDPFDIADPGGIGVAPLVHVLGQHEQRVACRIVHIAKLLC